MAYFCQLYATPQSNIVVTNHKLASCKPDIIRSLTKLGEISYSDYTYTEYDQKPYLKISSY